MWVTISVPGVTASEPSATVACQVARDGDAIPADDDLVDVDRLRGQQALARQEARDDRRVPTRPAGDGRFGCSIPRLAGWSTSSRYSRVEARPATTSK